MQNPRLRTVCRQRKCSIPVRVRKMLQRLCIVPYSDAKGYYVNILLSEVE